MMNNNQIISGIENKSEQIIVGVSSDQLSVSGMHHLESSFNVVPVSIS
jgi:hypothetical protein